VLPSIPRLMKSLARIVLVFSLVLACQANGFAKWLHGKSKKSANQDSATVLVDSGLAGCKVDVDGEAAGVTSAQGTVSIKEVDPGDHYLHVQCPGQRDTAYFISPRPMQQVQVNAQPATAASRQAIASPLASAVTEMQLRRMVTQGVQLRASGQFSEAVEMLRKATILDPRNGDLHRELGITFLMFHDWDSARVEMLEAVRREPDNVDAHSNLAYALEKLGDFDGALKQYRICTQMDPHDTSYRDHYIEVLGEQYAEKKQKKH